MGPKLEESRESLELQGAVGFGISLIRSKVGLPDVASRFAQAKEKPSFTRCGFQKGRRKARERPRLLVEMHEYSRLSNRAFRLGIKRSRPQANESVAV
jgi:hypothetical protein